MAGTAGPHTAFFYGTLMSSEVLYRVIYGTISPDKWQKDRLSIQPGLLYGYQRHRVKFADYPAIYPLREDAAVHAPESRRVLGTVVRGLSDMDVKRLDIFEGDQYLRKKVEAYPIAQATDAETHREFSGNSIQAETYVWDEKCLSDLESEEWDFEEFRREKLKYWAGPGVTRDDYEIVDDAVASGDLSHDGTGGRGANGSITKQLEDLQDGQASKEPLHSAV